MLRAAMQDILGTKRWLRRTGGMKQLLPKACCHQETPEVEEQVNETWATLTAAGAVTPYSAGVSNSWILGFSTKLWI